MINYYPKKRHKKKKKTERWEYCCSAKLSRLIQKCSSLRAQQILLRKKKTVLILNDEDWPNTEFQTYVVPRANSGDQNHFLVP